MMPRYNQILWPVFVSVALILGGLLSACSPSLMVKTRDPIQRTQRIQREVQQLETKGDRIPAGPLMRELAILQWTYQGRSASSFEVLGKLTMSNDDLLSHAARMIIADARGADELVWHSAMAILNQTAPDVRDSKPTESAIHRFASRRIKSLVERSSDKEQDFVRWFDTLDLSRFDPLVARVLLGLRASFTRGVGGNFEQYYRRQGCLKNWIMRRVERDFWEEDQYWRSLDRVAGVSESTKAPLNGTPSNLACAVRIWLQSPKIGTTVLEQEFLTESEDTIVEMVSNRPARFYWDGRLIYRSDRYDYHPARSKALAIRSKRGRHRIQVQLPGYENKSWFMVRASSESNKAIVAAVDGLRSTTDSVNNSHPKSLQSSSLSFVPDVLDSPGSPTSYRGVALYLALDEALATGDLDRAEEYAAELESFDKFAEAKLLLASWAKKDRSRGSQHRRNRQRNFLQETVEQFPEMARPWTELMELELRRGDASTVYRMMDSRPRFGQELASAQWLKWKAATRLGDDEGASASLDRLKQINPRDCRSLLGQRNLAQSQGQERQLDSIVAGLARCKGTLEIRAEHARKRGHLRWAEMLWREKLRRVPDDLNAFERLASLRNQQGRNDEALQIYQQVLQFNPQRSSAQIAVADLLRLKHDGFNQAKTWVARSLQLNPSSRKLWKLGHNLGLPDPLLDSRKFPNDIFEKYLSRRAQRSSKQSAIVFKSDRFQIAPDGSYRRLVHEIRHLRNRSDLDRFGQFELEFGDQLIEFQTIKMDRVHARKNEGDNFSRPDEGKRVGASRDELRWEGIDAERLPFGDRYLLRNLEVGDFVNLEYMQMIGHDPELPGHVDLGVLTVQDERDPVFHAEIEVAYPSDIFLEPEPQHNCPDPTMDERQGLHWIRYHANEIPALKAEPFSRQASEDLMGVRLATPLSMHTWMNALARQLRPSLRTNHELRSLAQQIVRYAPDQYDKVRGIWHWVMQNITAGQNPSQSATRSLAERKGSRLTVMLSMLQAVGLRCQLWLVKNRFATDKGTIHSPRVDAYDALVIRVRLQDEKRWLSFFPVSSAWPIDYVPAAYRGMPMHLVPLRGQSRAATLKPNTPDVALPSKTSELQATQDSRVYHLDTRIDLSGRAMVSGTIELRGEPLIVWRTMREGTANVNLPKVFEQLELVHWKPADIELQSVAIVPVGPDHSDSLEGPDVSSLAGMKIEFELEIPNFVDIKGSKAQIPSVVIALDQVQAFTQLKTRARGLILLPAVSIVVTMRFQLDGYRFAQIPNSVSLGNSALAGFQRRVLGMNSERTQLDLHFASQLQSTAFPPDAYPQLRKVQNDITAAEGRKLQLVPLANKKAGLRTGSKTGS